MKGLSITGFIIAILLLIVALYLQFVVAPGVAALESAINYEDESGLSSMMWAQALSFKSSLGIILLLGGILPLGLCAVPAFKAKNKLALAGFAISLVVIFIGLAHGTHMFS